MVNADVRTYPLTSAITRIGRDPQNDIVIDSQFQFVSGFHFKIERNGDQYCLVHPVKGNTKNGFIYQGEHIQGSESFHKVLDQGDVFRIGDTGGKLVTLTFDDGSLQTIVPDVHSIPLNKQEITIGRDSNNTVVLQHPQVSGNHASLIREQGTYRIEDRGSTNHIYVNGSSGNQRLKVNDEIRIGPYKFIYTGPQLRQYDESNSVRIEARNLKRYSNNQAILLNDISFTIPARKFVALLGGSGAGKTTLMNALSGFRRQDEGEVLYNGQDYYKYLDAFKTQIGYVPQEDIVHRELNIERALYYGAKMRLPEDFSDVEITQRINEVLEDVDLVKRGSQPINSLSGGERKRVSIALELLAKPTVFFLR